MTALKLVRLIGAATVVASAPVLLALAVHAQQPAPPADTQQQPKSEAAPRPGLPPAMEQKPAPAAPADQAAKSGDQKDPLVGLPVFGSDGRKVGDVEQVKAAPDGKLEAIHVRTGGFLGFGSRMVAIPAGKFVRSGTNVQVSLSSSDISALPPVEAKRI